MRDFHAHHHFNGHFAGESGSASSCLISVSNDPEHPHGTGQDCPYLIWRNPTKSSLDIPHWLSQSQSASSVFQYVVGIK